MKKLFKKLALMVVALLTFSVGSNYTVKEVRAADYVETTFCEGKFLITTTFNGTTYYLPAATTSSAPKAASFANVLDISEDNLWTVTAEGSNWYIQNSAGKYLYTIKSNNGVRVGDTANAWKYDAKANSFQDTVTNRFLGIYNSQDWRCYTTVNAGNYQESSTSFKFYKISESSPSLEIEGESVLQVNEFFNVTVNSKNLTEEIIWTSSNSDVASVENGFVKALKLGSTTIKATADGVSDEFELIVYPVANSEISISDALVVCELTGNTNSPFVYSVTGIVKSIDTEYSEEHDNISVTITDGKYDIKAYRMKGGVNLEEGNKIKVTGELINYSGNTPEFATGCTFELIINDNLPNIISSLNEVDSYMSLAYNYESQVEEEEIMDTTSVEYKDTLEKSSTTAKDQNYVAWTYESNSSSVNYAGQSAGSNESIQLRSNNNNSGIVTTKSANTAKKITVIWNENTSNGRTLNVYGSNTAYTNPTDLYNSSTQGTLLGSIVCGTSTELVIEGEYKYIGLRSASSAMYLTSISITWENETSVGTGEFEKVTNMLDSQFYIRCGADKSLAEIDNVASYGIRVSAGDNVVEYRPDTATSWGVDSTYNYCYVVLNLGNVFDNEDKLTTEFTVSAFVEVDGIIYTSEKTKTYSVVSMVQYYYESEESTDEVKSQVEHLYNYFVENGYIA